MAKNTSNEDSLNMEDYKTTENDTAGSGSIKNLGKVETDLRKTIEHSNDGLKSDENDVDGSENDTDKSQVGNSGIGDLHALETVKKTTSSNCNMEENSVIKETEGDCNIFVVSMYADSGTVMIKKCNLG